MSQREAVVAGSTSDHQGKEARSRKRSATEMDVDESFSEEAVKDVYNEYFFPKFLTSRELLELEVWDVNSFSVLYQWWLLICGTIVARRCQFPANRPRSISYRVSVLGWVSQRRDRKNTSHVIVQRRKTTCNASADKAVRRTGNAYCRTVNHCTQWTHRPWIGIMDKRDSHADS